MHKKYGYSSNRFFTEGNDRDISLSPTSVDKQIDSLLVSFQDDASETPDDVVPEGVTSMFTALMLLEAAEEEEGETEQPVTSDADQRTDDPGAALVPKLNIDDFASKVATLIKTASKRLDVETVIFNRAKNFIVDEYGADVGVQLTELLTNTYDVDIAGEGEDDVDGDNFAVGATGPSL